MTQQPGHRSNGILFAAAGALVLSVAGELLATSLGVGGLVTSVGTMVIVVLVAVLLAPSMRYWRSRRRQPAPDQAGAEVRSCAEQAQHWLVALGSSGGGMAAAEWFELQELALHRLVDTADPAVVPVDDIARIADALDGWYVRQRRGPELLRLGERLGAIGHLARRPDLQELATLRVATAHRLLGELDAAAACLDDEPAASHGEVAAALRSRRLLERGLLHLAYADRCASGEDRADAVRNARDRFHEAGLIMPRADLAADIALHIDLAVTYLYDSAAGAALEHLRLAWALADAAHDTGAQAHAFELAGVAALTKGNAEEAVSWWQEAERRYAKVGEREGRARCLQHLGALALTTGELPRAVDLLSRCAQLRGGAAGNEVLAHYLDRLSTECGVDVTGRPPDPPPPRRRINVLPRLRRRSTR